MSAPTRPCIVLAAGGTGGHVFPAAALAAALVERGARPVVVTDRRGEAFKGLPEGTEVRQIRAGGVAGLGMVDRIRNLAFTAIGTLEARRLLRALKADAVIGFGGYAALPTTVAATFISTPAMIHEQNAILGRANRLLAKRVARVAASFDRIGRVPPTGRHKVIRTGMPVRPAFLEAGRVAYQAPAANGPVCLVILGGSQGARVFSEVVPAAVERLDEALRRRLRITQQCRPEDLEAVRGAYAGLGVEADLQAFFSDVPQRLAAAHLLIVRAGASTVAEVAAAGRPAVFVPYPFAADDHQTANARAMHDVGGGWLMPQPDFTPDHLAAELTRLIASPGALTAVAEKARAAAVPDAAARLAGVVLALAGGIDKPAAPVRAEDAAA